MATKKIRSRIQRTEQVNVNELVPFQGEAKKLTLERRAKLRKVMIEEGFAFAVHAVELKGKKYLVDGHQRVDVLKEMAAEGYEIPLLECSFISARSHKEIKKLINMAISQYGKLDKQGFWDFIGDDDFDFDDFDFPDVDDDFFDTEDDDESGSGGGKTDDDQIPDVDDNPYGVVRGDVWLLGAYYECPACKKEYTLEQGKAMKEECSCA